MEIPPQTKCHFPGLLLEQVLPSHWQEAPQGQACDGDELPAVTSFPGAPRFPLPVGSPAPGQALAGSVLPTPSPGQLPSLLSASSL